MAEVVLSPPRTCVGYAVIANSQSGFAGREARRPAWSGSAASAVAAAEGHEGDDSPQEGIHPPSATTATTSAAPSPAMTNPVLKLP